MKKTTKKLLAILLTMVMAIGMGVTSFAATNSTKEVAVQIIGEGNVSIFNDKVSVDTDKSSYTTNETDIENYKVAGTAYDALVKAATLGSTKVQYLEQQGDNWVPIDRWGLAIESVNGVAQKTDDIIIDVDEDGTETHKVTYGYWSLYINGAYADEYATAYVLDSASNPVTSVKLAWDSYSYTYTK